MLLVLAGSGILWSQETGQSGPESSLPPVELLKSNFDRASIVVAVQLVQKNITEKMASDEGSVGYIITKESGNIFASFKGNMKANQHIEYSDWLEYQKGWEEARGDSVLVFLTFDPHTQIYHTIDEAAVFPWSHALHTILIEIKGGKGASKRKPGLQPGLPKDSTKILQK